MIVVVTFFFVLGIAYSYFAANIEGSETSTTITAEAGYLNIVYEGGPDITAESFGPSEFPFATKTFTVKGNSTIANANMDYKIILIINENTFTDNAISYTLDSDNIGDNGNVVLPTTQRQNLTTENKTLGTGKFQGIVTNAIHSYTLKLYFYETGEDQTIDMNKTFEAHIGIENYDPCAAGNCLKDLILAEGGGASVIEAKGNPTFSKIAVSQATYDSLPDSGDHYDAIKAKAVVENGLYATEDEYGTSYYYRGEKNLLNNNLIFGGFQWKIIRINGDGSIRIMYHGTEAEFTANETMNSAGGNAIRQPWDSHFNDARGLGYMYGASIISTSRNGTVSTAATYNETSSNAKVQLESWYQTNIFNQPFESKIVDNLFCNDRQKQDDLGIGGPATGPGYGEAETTLYAAYYRLITNKAPTLRCGQQNDRFTKNDTTIGNGALTYPIGLITADEASMAGLVNYVDNSVNYLYSNDSYWTFTPFVQGEASTGSMGGVSAWGSPPSLGEATLMDGFGGLRPILNLSSDVTVTGGGTEVNPYRVILD